MKSLSSSLVSRELAIRVTEISDPWLYLPIVSC